MAGPTEAAARKLSQPVSIVRRKMNTSKVAGAETGGLLGCLGRVDQHVRRHGGFSGNAVHSFGKGDLE